MQDHKHQQEGKTSYKRITSRTLRIELSSAILHNCLVKRFKFGWCVRIQVANHTRCDDLHIDELGCASRTPSRRLQPPRFNLHLSIMRWGSMRDTLILACFLFIPLSFPIVFVPIRSARKYLLSRRGGATPTSSFPDQLLLLYLRAGRALLL